MPVEERSEWRDWKWNNSSKRSGIANRISWDKNITNRNRQQMYCKQFDVTVEKIISACQILAKKNSTYRDMIQCVLNCCVTCLRKWGENYKANSCMTFYRNLYKPVMKVRLPYCGTNRNVCNNKPDSMMRYNKQWTCMSIDVAISADRNVNKKEAAKILKYEYLTIEIKCMWNVKAKVIPVTTGRLEPSQNHSHSIWATYRRSTKSRNYRNQSYWALHRYCWCKGTECI